MRHRVPTAALRFLCWMSAAVLAWWSPTASLAQNRPGGTRGSRGEPGRAAARARTRPSATRPTPGQPWVVAVLPPQVGETTSGPLVERFRRSVAQAFRQAGQTVVDEHRTTVALLRHPLWTECRVGECLEQLASELGADMLVRCRVLRDEVGKNYEFAMWVFDAMGRIRWQARSRCDICTIAEAAGSLGELASRAAKALGTKPAPPPLECPRSCGKGRVCRGGKCVPVVARPPRPRAKKRRPKPTRPAPRAARRTVVHRRARPPWLAHPPWGQFSLVTLGVAAAAAITGGILLALDDRPTCSRPRPEITCPERYDTQGAGIGFLVFSAAGAVGAAVLGYLWWRQRGGRHESARGAHSRWRLRVTGPGAELTWHF